MILALIGRNKRAIKMSHLQNYCQYSNKEPGACFSNVPKLFGRHNSVCIFKTKASRGMKLCSYIYFHSLYNIWKDQLYTITLSEFYEWLFGPEKFSELSRNGALTPVPRKPNGFSDPKSFSGLSRNGPLEEKQQKNKITLLKEKLNLRMLSYLEDIIKMNNPLKRNEKFR